MKPIIELRHITKRFPGIVANDDVSLTIQKGEIFALLGENGAGKSTLMSILFGMYEPDEGEIFIRGEKVRITSPSHATKLNIGMVHQHFKLVENFTVTENIVLGMEPQKRIAGIFPTVDIKGTNQKIAELSKRYGLEVEPTAKIEDLSVSIQQRVEILKMLYREAEIMIFDEPTAMLTPQEIESLLQVIRNLRDAGKTIILITHKLEEIKQVADRCAVLCRGKLVSECDVATTSTHDMAYMMVGREVSEEMEKEPVSPGEEVLRIENLTVKNSAGFPVVKDVSFSIHEGEIFAVAGVSGNGQEELADAIAGMVKAAGGKIYLAGQDITQMPIRKRNESGVAYIPADRHATGMVMDFTLSENLLLKNYYKPPYCVHGWLKRDRFDKKSSELIEKYDIRCGQGCDTIVRSMSGGNQQKAIIAREIDQNAKVILFVQPTRGLDIGAIENIHRQILEQRSKGKAILLISLELEEVMKLADTIGVIYSGELLKTAPAESLTVNQVGNYMMGVTT
ncbi:MAG TPA: ABC transporter ATP-binding protein [Candidatus Ruthenibacterium merdavium]|uniref:ABC transporter ATP-binding protein n=1 Tax=Candidatus Ruthenibacterium merdavium TaxID=2838752 RepID=A0A9D2TJW0_9FIRM|nr:ABC transporter ATP-binding protein [Candidatus Ruthenibacterium merdavium]